MRATHVMDVISCLAGYEFHACCECYAFCRCIVIDVVTVMYVKSITYVFYEYCARYQCQYVMSVMQGLGVMHVMDLTQLVSVIYKLRVLCTL